MPFKISGEQKVKVLPTLLEMLKIKIVARDGTKNHRCHIKWKICF